MNRPAKIGWTGILALAAMLALLIARSERAAKRSRSELRALVDQHTAAEAELRKLRASSAELKDPPAVLAPVSPPARESLPPSPVLSQGEALRDIASRRQALLQRWSGRQFLPFARTTGLSAAQFEGLQNAIAAHWLRWSEVVDVGREQGVAQADPKWAELAKQEWAQYFKEAQAVIGADAVKELWQFERRAPAKAATETVAALVFDSGEPLTAKQAAALTEAMVQSSARFRQGGQVSLDDIDKPLVLEQLHGVLSPLQLAALQTSWTAREAGPRLTRLIAEALKQNPKGN
jgi:hypothetical protein